MPKQKGNNKKEDDNKKDLVIKIILIIIIILLLLHNCSLIKKTGKKEGNKENIIDITCNADKCQQQQELSIDCLKDEENSKCLVPDFVGKTKKDVLKWLSSISNTLEIEIRTVENSDYSDGTVLEQSIVGTSVKDLLAGKTKLVITIVNNGSLVDCQKDSKNSKCTLPNFIGKKRSNVENWVDGIANNINIKYIYVDSNKPAGTIINQSINSGTSIKNILEKGETVVIYISKGKKTTPIPNNNNSKQADNTPSEDTPTPSPTPEPEPEIDDDFYVSDKEKVKWQDDIDLNIFEDSTSISKVRGKIAPESKGTYKFIVNNGTQYNLKYSISFAETNQHNMNMKYKLKKGDTYLIDHYVPYNQLNIDDMLLNSNSSDTYYLEWKWDGENDDNDTQIGKNAKSSNITYNLKISVEAESV